MKLADKGRFAPPPSLPTHAQAVSLALASWPSVHARTHWELGDESRVDGADFYLGDAPDAEEIGHLHLHGEAHVALPRKVASAVIDAGLGGRFRWSAEIVTFPVDSAAAVGHALWLFQLRYDQLRGAKTSHLLEQVDSMARGRRGTRQEGASASSA